MESHGENVAAARAVGLRYVNADEPGISRRPAGKGFSYRQSDGAPVTDESTLARIRSLAVPPAWTDVWLCRSATGHIQATGRDARGRKQYRYHPTWSKTRDEAKFDRTIDFARALPRLRRRIDRDLRRLGLPRDKVVAAVVRLLESTLIRVGNEEYARDNRSYGLTTLRNRHAQVNGASLKFTFRGKSGVAHSVGVHDRRLGRVVKACQDLPGQQLFQYVDERGEIQAVDSENVNDYLREAMGDDFTAKDFRTWAGTLLAVRAIGDIEGNPKSAAAALPTKKLLADIVKEVAGELGNTPTVCRNCYIHPAVVDAFMEGAIPKRRSGRSAGEDEERAVLSILLRGRKASRARAA